MGSNLVEFVCPENLLIIEKYAFANCVLLKSFTFNEKISQLNDYTFYNVGLEELYIPNSLKSITVISFWKSPIRFKYSEGGHPVYYVENNCFMNNTDGLMFIISKKANIFEIPKNVKIISNEALSDYDYDRFVINSDIHDSNFLYFENYNIRFCITSPEYDIHSNEKCQLEIFDKLNVDRYKKEGEYEPTYKLNNKLYMDESFWYFGESVTETTSEVDYANKSLPFLEDLNMFSTIHVVLLSIITLLSVVIIILTVMVLKITHE